MWLKKDPTLRLGDVSNDDMTRKAAIEADLGNGITLGTFVACIAFAIIFQDVSVRRRSRQGLGSATLCV